MCGQPDRHYAVIIHFPLFTKLLYRCCLICLRDKCGFQTPEYPSHFYTALGSSFSQKAGSKICFCHNTLSTNVANVAEPLTTLDSKATVLCPVLCDPLRKIARTFEKYTSHLYKR